MTRYRHVKTWGGEQRCPHCHSDNIDYSDSGEYDDYYYYEMYCNECNAVFTQYYHMVPTTIKWSTDEEYREDERDEARRLNEALEMRRLQADTLPADIPMPPPPVYEPIRHNYDLVKDDPYKKVEYIEVPQCQGDSATRNPLIPHVDWQAISQALQED